MCARLLRKCQKRNIGCIVQDRLEWRTVWFFCCQFSFGFCCSFPLFAISKNQFVVISSASNSLETIFIANLAVHALHCDWYAFTVSLLNFSVVCFCKNIQTYLLDLMENQFPQHTHTHTCAHTAYITWTFYQFAICQLSAEDYSLILLCFFVCIFCNLKVYMKQIKFTNSQSYQIWKYAKFIHQGTRRVRVLIAERSINQLPPDQFKLCLSAMKRIRSKAVPFLWKKWMRE